MTQHLVVTAVGTDRAGIVNELTQLVSSCGCNIVDSRMALFGSEFTLIMLLAGPRSAMIQVETRLPIAAQELQLLTVLKPTSPHQAIESRSRAVMELTLPDAPGVISQVTQFISDTGLNMRGLKSDLFVEAQQEMLRAEFTADLGLEQDEQQVSEQYLELCKKLNTSKQQIQFIRTE